MNLQIRYDLDVQLENHRDEGDQIGKLGRLKVGG
jgi:hypothetical protein